jgi:hypothetical protein
MLLLICVSTSPVAEKPAVPNVLKGEEDFVNSLKPDQQNWWTKNRQKVFDSVVNATIGVSGQSDQNKEAVEEIEDFIKSLNPTQRELWSKLRSKADTIITEFIASRGTHYPGIELHRHAACGGGCILSTQCVNWDGGNRNCRCSWFSCGLV